MTLLAVSVDSAETRPNIPSYLEKNGVHCRVLLGDPDNPEPYSGIGAGFLYIVDRNGYLAGVPKEFEPDFENKAQRRIAQLLSSDSQPGPLLFASELEPEGFALLWKCPLDQEVSALAIAPAGPGRPAEIGVLDAAHLSRISAAGAPLGEAAIASESPTFLEGADLDGDGQNEWVIGGKKSFVVTDAKGAQYWGYYGRQEPLRFVGFSDLDGDGALDMVVRDDRSVTARKTPPRTLWVIRPEQGLKAVVPDPGGSFLMQTESGVQVLDRQGHPAGRARKVPSAAQLAGRIEGPGGGFWDLLSYPGGPEVQVLDRFTKIGRKEILATQPGMLSAYSSDGKPQLLLDLVDFGHAPVAAVGDLDGQPGDEILLAIPRYGLVALKVSSPSAAAEPARNAQSGSRPPER